MAFQSLTEKLANAFKRFRSKGKLTASDVKEGMREIKLALLEADVSFKVVKDFIKNVTERAIGSEVLESLLPAQQVVKIVHEELIKLINSKVGRKDTLLLLGDVGDLEYAKQLRGKKILVCGNHDSGHSNYEHCWWKEWFDKDKFQKDEAIAEMQKMYPGCRYTIDEDWSFRSPFESWVITADNMLFDEVYCGCLMIGEKVILSHEPIENLPPWLCNLHGHDHSGRRNGKRHFNFCADVIGYVPVNLNQWFKQGHLANIESIHRETIDAATKRKIKRGGKKIGEK